MFSRSFAARTDGFAKGNPRSGLLCVETHGLYESLGMYTSK